MDCKIWKEALLSWVNSLGISISPIQQITPNTLKDIIKLVKTRSDEDIVSFFNSNFPNYIISEIAFATATERDILCMSTYLLMYICFSTNEDFSELRQRMCDTLNSTAQEYITEFLSNMNEQGDVFLSTQKKVMEEILKLSQRHSLNNSATGDGLRTPAKSNSTPGNCNSPLLEFLQTPKRISGIRSRRQTNSYDNDQLKKIKELTDQLVEEELEKASLQERLKWHEMTCHEYEMKLKNKIKELENLQNNWQQDMCKNDLEMKKYQSIIEHNTEERQKLVKELDYFEKYTSDLENDMSTVTSEKKQLEEKLKTVLKKVDDYENDIKELTTKICDLETVTKTQEEELEVLRENDRGNVTVSDRIMNETLDTSVSAPENMGLVVDMLLKEKTEENELLIEAIETMKADKECLTKEVDALTTKLAKKEEENDNLKEMNKMLVGKLDEFVKSSRDLRIAQSKLMNMFKEVCDDPKDKVNFLRKTCSSNDSNGNTSPEKMIVTLFNEIDSKELHVIYDSPKDLIDSNSQFSMDDNDTCHLTTILESSNESDCSSQCALPCKGDFKHPGLEQFHMEELNHEIITAKKSLISFLKASMKNFEVLKIKENLLDEMAKQHNHLESRITSLTELNAKLKDEIIKSKTISEIDSQYREQELENLRLEVESLKKAATFLKEKLEDLEKTNEILMAKKKECISELALLREKNKSLNNDLQCRVMSQMMQQNSCLGFIRYKQETELELEKALKLKNEIDKRIMDLRKLIEDRDSKTCLETSFSSTEQKFYITSQNLFHTTYNCLKWSAKIMEHQCFLIGRQEHYSENNVSEVMLKKEQEEDRKRLKEIVCELNGISDELDEIERKSNEPNELNDSLKIVPSINKTFEIINIDEENINEKTFWIKREDNEVAKDSKAVWVISPPSKQVHKNETKIDVKKKPSQGESWVIPLVPQEKSELKIKKVEEVTVKTSYYSTLSDIEYSPPTKSEITKSSSATSFTSACDSVEPITESVEETAAEPSNNFASLKKCLEEKIEKQKKELESLMKENEALRKQLAECEEKRRHEKENFEKRQEATRQNVTAKYENQLEHLKSEMKALYNRELAKHKSEQSKLNSELREQNKSYKDHVDELRNQLWDLGEKLLQEQKVKRDLERNLDEMKTRFLKMSSADLESRSSQDSDHNRRKEQMLQESFPPPFHNQFGSSSLATMPTEDEEEVFDNRCLEDMKAGICKVEGPEGRLTELQYRNSLCPPHLKSSYPAETQFHNPKLYKENDLRFGALNFGQESHSLTDSDHSMTRSLLPVEEKGKKKEQTSYKKPGPPTPSKNGGRLSIQSGEFHLTPRRPLRESNDFTDRKSTPGRIRALFTTKTAKQDVSDCRNENAAPAASRGKKLKIFSSVKPFGGRDY